MTDLILFPDSFNALRKELYENWRESIWPRVSYAMVWDKQVFMDVMNEVTGCLCPDILDLDTMSKTYLDALRMKRGLSPLHLPSEKYEEKDE